MLAIMRLTEQITAHSSAASPAAQGQVWSLAKGQLRSVFLAEGEHRQIEILHGECWITMEGDANDYVFVDNDTVQFQGPGLLIVEALNENALVKVHQRVARSTDL